MADTGTGTADPSKTSAPRRIISFLNNVPSPRVEEEPHSFGLAPQRQFSNRIPKHSAFNSERARSLLAATSNATTGSNHTTG
jgi:hypothetical protein